MSGDSDYDCGDTKVLTEKDLLRYKKLDKIESSKKSDEAKKRAFYNLACDAYDLVKDFTGPFSDYELIKNYAGNVEDDTSSRIESMRELLTDKRYTPRDFYIYANILMILADDILESVKLQRERK